MLKARSQFKYLERRIRRHKSSSLELIIEAIKSLTKAIKGNIYKIILLRAKVKDLREVNKILS